MQRSHTHVPGVRQHPFNQFVRVHLEREDGGGYPSVTGTQESRLQCQCRLSPGGLSGNYPEPPGMQAAKRQVQRGDAELDAGNLQLAWPAQPPVSPIGR
jgi:hypothetical protein